MGFNISWFAADNTSKERIAETLGLELGEETDFPDTAGVTTIGEWTLVLSRGDQLVTESDLAALSKDGAVVTHQSVDSVMYASTFEYLNGVLERKAVVDLDQPDESDVVDTTGHSEAQRKKLERLNRKSGPSAYDEVAEIARRRVGFRHDQGATKFWELIDTRPTPKSPLDDLEDWLLAQGFRRQEGKFPDHINFTREVDSEFSVRIGLYPKDRNGHSSLASYFRIMHGPTQAIISQIRGWQRDSPLADKAVATVGALRMAWQSELGDHRSAEERDQMVDDYLSLIAEAEDRCTLEGIAHGAPPMIAFALELLQGWSTRGDSLMRQLEFLGHDERELAFMQAVLEEQAEVAREVPIERSERSETELQTELAARRPLSGVELATMHEAAGGTAQTCKELQFELWSLAIDSPELSQEIAVNIIDHHIPLEDLRIMARRMPLGPDSEAALMQHPDINIHHDVAKNPSMSETAMALLAAAGDNYSIGENPSLPSSAQRLLLDNASTPYVLESLAGNPSLDPQLQVLLSKSKTFQVREALARNRSVEPEIVHKLSKDRKGEVKSTALMNPNLPEDRQIDVAGGKSGALGLNSNLCFAAQELLVSRGELAHVPRNPALDATLMERIARDGDVEARAGLARNPSLTAQLQELLSSDPEPRVRSQVARREDLDESLRARLKEDSDASVRKSSSRLGPLRRHEDGVSWSQESY